MEGGKRQKHVSKYERKETRKEEGKKRNERKEWKRFPDRQKWLRGEEDGDGRKEGWEGRKIGGRQQIDIHTPGAQTGLRKGAETSFCWDWRGRDRNGKKEM
jgi:hypothetical protein